jgi:hypothetical protein
VIINAHGSENTQKTHLDAVNGKKVELIYFELKKNAPGSQKVLEAVVNEVLRVKMDAAALGCCIAQLVQTSINLLEVGDIDQRLQAIERRLGIKT